MQTLIIILIVTMIIQTVIFTYSNFVDENRNKQLTSFQEQMKNAQADYIAEKRKFEKIIDGRDDTIHELIVQRNDIFRSLDTLQQTPEHKSLRPQNTWKPSDEQMESLKGILNSLPHQEVLYSLYQDLMKLKG